MFHLAAWYASVDQGAAYTTMAAAVPEPVLFVSGNDIHVPAQLPNAVGFAAGLASGGQSNFRVTAPSLRGVSRMFGVPINGFADADAIPDATAKWLDLRDTPLPFVPPEVVNVDTHADPTVARKQWVLVWLADGPIQSLGGLKIYAARATATTTLTVGQWTLCPITFDDSMPTGNIQVVGLRARSAGIIAARFAFIGQQFRPGVLGSPTVAGLQPLAFRWGEFGVFGSFTIDTLPQIEVLSTSADTAEVFELDIVLS